MMSRPSKQLLRVLSTTFGVAVVVGGTIGQGILRTPGLIAQNIHTAWLILLLWLVGGLVILIDAMSSVELASSIRLSGGPYTFARRAFGQSSGLAVGLADWLGNMAGIAYVSVVFAEYMHRAGIGTSVPTGLLAATLPFTAGLIHVAGTRVGGLSQEIGSAVKALLYGLLIAALLLGPRAAPAQAVHETQVTALGLIIAVRAIIGAYGGWNTSVYFSEEMQDPERSIARSTFVGIAGVIAVYMMVNIALLHVMTPTDMAGSDLVAADAAGRAFGTMPQTAEWAITVISLVSVATIANVMIMQFPRVLFAIARNVKMPWLSHVASNGTPQLALFATAGSSALLATLGAYDRLLTMSVSLPCAMAICMNLAAIILRYREPWLERPYRMPAFPLPAIFSLLTNGVLLVAFLYEDPRDGISAFLLLGFIVLSFKLAARSI